VKIPVSWLRDFVDVPDSPEDLGETLTLRGFELSNIERANIVPLGSDPRTVPGSDPVGAPVAAVAMPREARNWSMRCPRAAGSSPALAGRPTAFPEGWADVALPSDAMLPLAG